MSQSIVSLRDAKSETHFGAKAVRLGEALRHGFPVPEGFAIPTEVLESLAGGDAKSIAELQDMYRGLGVAVAVRSSAPGEDSPEASHAGQFVSRLNIISFSGLLQALLEVRKSAFSEAVLSYRQSRGLTGLPQMAAIVQHQIAADVAGTLYTRDPTSGQNDRIVEASWGLGSSVASALVRPDYFRISGEGRIVESRIGSKTRAIRPAPAGGTIEEAASSRRGQEPCLDDSKLRALEALASRAESIFGSSLDIEWAYSDDQLWLLQVRPLVSRSHGVQRPISRGDRASELVGTSASLRLRGKGASLGTVEGVARFHPIAGPCHDCILLILGPITPELALEFREASGVVASSGGITAHGANILREFSVPCLVGVEGLEEVEEGSLVRLDCFEGTLEVFDAL